MQQIFLSAESVFPEKPQNTLSVLFVEKAETSFQKNFLETLDLPLKGAYEWAGSLAKTYADIPWCLLRVQTPVGTHVLIACQAGVVLFVRTLLTTQENIEETKKYMMRFGLQESDIVHVVEVTDPWPTEKGVRFEHNAVARLIHRYYKDLTLKWGGRVVVALCFILCGYFFTDSLLLYNKTRQLEATMPQTEIDQQDASLARLVALSNEIFPLEDVLSKIRSLLPPEIVLVTINWSEREMELHLAAAHEGVVEQWVEDLQVALVGYTIENDKMSVRIRR